MTDRSFYTRWLIGGIVMLLIVAGACYLWYRYDTAPYRKAAAEAEELLRQSEKLKRVSKTGKNAEQVTDVTPAEGETPTVEKNVNEATPMMDKTEPSQAENPAQNAETAEVRVSPHGFGPFPEVPEDYPEQDVFETISDDPVFELMDRVQIKLWKQGVQTIGMSEEGGLFYPTIPGTIYVDFERIEYGPGIVFRSSSLSGDPETIQRLGPIDWKLPLEEISFPPDIKVIDAKEGGIDPYVFLNLQKE